MVSSILARLAWIRSGLDASNALYIYIYQKIFYGGEWNLNPYQFISEFSSFEARGSYRTLFIHFGNVGFPLPLEEG